MKKKQRLLVIMTILVFFTLVACSDSTDEAKAKPINEASENSMEQKKEEKPATDEEVVEINKSENPERTQIKNKETSSESSTTVNEPSNSKINIEATDRTKAEYLKELNEMEDADKYGEVKTTTVELEEQETERYQKWDQKLNEIYGVLNEQLDSGQMEQLREEQQEWIKYRDETAKESSLKYQGGSMESLEYVATMANLTRERCYALVAKYMK